jgi:RNA polymerase sigma factor for flagellar operon FliA
MPTLEATEQRDDIIRENLPLVRQVAQRFHVGPSSPVEMQDLVQLGVIGLIDACEKFDDSKGTTFQSYARFRIRGAILDGLRHLDFLPRSVRRKRRELMAATQRVEQLQGAAASAEDIADELEIDQDELAALMESVRGATLASVEEMTERGCEVELAEAMGATVELGPEGALDREETRDLVAAAIESLPKKERMVLSLYYFEELTMREVGEVLGVTESRVSQLHSKALERLELRIHSSSALKVLAPA